MHKPNTLENTCKKRILVVEDEPTLRNIYQILLENSGYEVVLSENGKEGLEKFVPGEYDAIISDNQMPYLNGMDLIPLLCGKEKLANYLPIPKIIVSGDVLSESDESSITKFLEVGASKVFPKPNKFSEIVQYLNDYFLNKVSD